MMNPHTKTYYKGKCPSCRSIIEFHSIHFTIDNDKGEMVSTCNNCEAMFRIVTRNPDESYIAYGARKNSSIDYETESASAYPDISEVVLFEGSLNDTMMIFDPNSKPLYVCSSCGEGLEKKAFSKLEETSYKLIQAYHDYTTVDIKGYGFNPEKAIFKLNLICSCNKEYSAVFYKKYDHNGFDISDFNLGSIIGSTPLEKVIDGTMSKDDCMELLKKALVRWELLFDKILIITPFVGNQYLSDEKLIDTWFSILSQISKDKAKLITRSASLKKVKQAISNHIFDYEFLKDYDLSVTHIDKAIKLQPSHAKIYCGFSENYSEMIHGSANIAYGPSREQISFKSYGSYKDLYDSFLAPLDIKDASALEYSNMQENGSNVLFEESEGFRAKQIQKEDFAGVLI